MDPVSTVVATRYHNVICALMLAKPTISIGYGEKNAVLMAGTGLADYCQSIGSLDVDRLIEQFTDLESHAAQLRQTVAEGNRAKAPLVERQRAELSACSSRLRLRLRPWPSGERPSASRRESRPSWVRICVLIRMKRGRVGRTMTGPYKKTCPRLAGRLGPAEEPPSTMVSVS